MSNDDGSAGRSVAFLRGINLGRRRATKQQLIAAVSAFGLSDVDTFLASGNVLFTWPVSRADTEGAEWADDRAALEARLREGLESELGYEVPLTVRTAGQLRALAEAEPFDADQLAASGGKPQIMLLFEPLDDDAIAPALAVSTDDDLLVHQVGELFWLPNNGVGRSRLDSAALEKALGGTMLTVRTANTIDRLVARL